MIDSTTAVLIGIVALTAVEVLAVVAVALFGHGEQSALIGTLVGIVGPVVATFIAVWNSAAARKEVASIRASGVTVPPPAAAPTEPPA